MSSLNIYTDKENLQIGRPVVKGSDVDKVRRNLCHNALKPKNHFDSSRTSLHLNVRTSVNSPVTDLTNTFTELVAHEASVNNTPKRRLSLTSSSGSPTPDMNRLKALFSCTKSSTSGSSSSNNSFSSQKGSISKVCIPSRKTLDQRFGNDSAFRRYSSMPNGDSSNEASPLLNSHVCKLQLSPMVSSPKQPMFFMPGEDSSDSGLGKEEEFKFVAPTIPPEKAQAYNEQSPIRMVVCKGADVIGSPDIFDSRAQDTIDSPLLAHKLCDDEEVDDGFIDLDDLEKQNVTVVPDAIANMLTGKMVSELHPVKSMKASLFRSPSIPSKLASTEHNSFDIRKRILCSKRPEPPRDNNTPVTANKKRRAVFTMSNMPTEPNLFDGVDNTSVVQRLQRCKSMVEHSASYELKRSDSDGALTGDFSKVCCLPLVNGKHNDLKCISPETMAAIVNREYDDRIYRCSVIDCRYPYEFDGGHIKGAKNIFTKEDIYSEFLQNASLPEAREDGRRSILIFHCEFSSERAPRLSRFLRNHDREKNNDNYPSLFYPEIYLLEGGYKAFYEQYKNLCVPDTYKPMLHKDHSDDLKNFRAKCKSWPGIEKRGAARPGLMRKL